MKSLLFTEVDSSYITFMLSTLVSQYGTGLYWDIYTVEKRQNIASSFVNLGLALPGTWVTKLAPLSSNGPIL